MLIVDRDNLRQPFVPTVDTMGSQNQGQECKTGAIKAINHQVTDERIISILLLRVISIAIMIITITIILPKACTMIMNHH